MRHIKAERAPRALGLGLMLGVLGCGGKAAEGSQPEAPTYSAPRATPPSPASPPVGSAGQLQPAPPLNPSPQPPPTPPPPQPLPGVAELSRAAAENVLASNCGQCHGPALTPAQAPDGLNYIDDIDRLVETGRIVPLSSATSRIIVLMRNGTEPPPGSGLPPLSDADIAIVASYIDDPRFWPILVPENGADAGTEAPIVDAGADGA
jgi:mono/diheme cytochrome c family protein